MKPTTPQDTVVDLSTLRTTCEKCSLYKLCLPMGLSTGDMDHLDKIIKRHRQIERGDHLFNINEPLVSVFAVRTGSFKSYTVVEDGQEQVTGFHLPGELLGLSAISTAHHTCAAKALETSSICEIPFSRLESLSAKIPELQHHLMHVMSEEIQNDQCKLLLIAKMTAEARLASFLLNLSGRFKLRGYAPNEFNLSMSRNDIANLLGLAVETVSRLFTAFQEDGMLRVERKHVELLDMKRLTVLTTKCAQACDKS